MEYVVLILGLSFALAWWDAQRRKVNAAAEADLAARVTALEAVNAGSRLDELESRTTGHHNQLESLRGRAPKRQWG